MKRLLLVISLLVSLVILSSCNTELVAIEECEWKMSAVMSDSGDSLQNANDFVIAVGEADEIHPDAKVVELILTAKNGKLTLTDSTNGKTYIGTYKVSGKTINSIDYEITVEGIKGYATVAQTKYYDGSERPTLPINLGNYSLYFVSND